MSAIASGTRADVRRWNTELTHAGIPSAAVESCVTDPDRPDYAELWVGQADVDRAREALGINW
jgi:hypothetical protein